MAQGSAAQLKAGEGLDALDEDVVLNELAGRGMDSLLEYAFKAGNVSKERQYAVRSLIALRKLTDPSAKVTTAQRQQLIADVVQGIEAALPSMRDPKLMLRQANTLLAAGVERDVNTLEYWGENPRTQSQLRPIVQTVVKLLVRCVEQSNAAAEEAANKIRNPDDKAAVARYEQLEQLAREAEYTKYMTDYYLVLSIDRADRSRVPIARKAIDFLKQYDVTDQPIRARVRNRIGKMAMVSGDFATARTMFDMVIEAPPAEFAAARPDLAMQYEARYFRAVTELLASRPDDALRRLDDLIAWQRTSLPNPAASTSADARALAQSVQEGASAAAAMLRYRILSLQADLATAPAKQQELSEQATEVLMELLRQQPSLQGIVYEQLAGRLSERPGGIAGLDSLLLQALIRRGESEVRRGADAPVDTKAVEQALLACDELLGRAGKVVVDPTTLDAAALLRGFFLDRLDRDPDATDAFLDYAEKNATSRNAGLALDNAQALLAQLRRDKPDDQRVVKLYERFLPLAIAPPFRRTQFAYEYARRLQLQGKAEEAAKLFDLVPHDDPRALAAHFFQTLALQQQLEVLRPGNPLRPALVRQIQDLAVQVRGQIDAALAGAKSDDERNNYRSMLARTTLLAAELARTEEHDPARAIQLLDGFEKSIEGLPDANRRTTDALLVRVQSLMALDRYSDATAQLVQLLDREPARGGRIVYDLLEKLNAELDRAQASEDTSAVRSIARNRAQLTGFLVQWAQKNQNESVRKLAYQYSVFDAEVQRFAAEHEADTAQREAGLRRALESFTRLNSPEDVARYKAGLPPSATADASAQGEITYDPAVVLGLARAQFALAQYTDARDNFSRLLNDRRLGPPVTMADNRGQQRETDNDNYWEAVLKLIRSNIALGSGVEESKSYLKQQLVRWGDRVGGTKWKSDFTRLREELIPGYDTGATRPTTAPSTSPAGA